MKFVIAGLRFFQFLFCAVVLGLSVSLAKGQEEGSAPATTNYSAFTGALGIVAAIVGLAALFVDPLNGIITWILDAVAALVLVAGGIAMTIGLKGAGNCSNIRSIYLNPLLSCGVRKDTEGERYPACGDAKNVMSAEKRWDLVKGRCRQARADEIFMFLGFAASVAALAVSFLAKRKRNAGGSGSYL